ncbi:uncharacterized protein LOC122068613 [Macadamia integrifolia]|uniref:uncharacterized protein LOC122068613 n=1 Tax=Macadamia integrifolia TaxID=60698 RepID=UPI001C500ECF|nr:uncharacterized protein LOC122068613 [Macadamia integrifolia]
MSNIDRLSRMSIDDEDPSLVVVVPEDLLIKVFSWLPMKSLLRFKCLSKRWLDVISNDSYFIHLRSQHSKSKDSKPPLLFYSSCIPPGVEDSMIILLQSSTDMEGRLLDKFEFNKMDFPLRRPLMLPTRFDLVCFISKNQLHVCNPSTHELITLPPLVCNYNDIFEFHGSFGFGYVESTDEYKIVHLIPPFLEKRYGYGADLPMQCTQCAVFTLGMTEGSTSSYGSPWAWKIIGNSPYNVEHLQCPAFVDGVLHWLIDRKHHPELMTDIEQTILAFNLESEEFGLVPRPRDCSDLAGIDLQMVELRGLLCLSCVDEGDRKMDIWMLKNYCNETRTFTWVKEYSIDLSTLAGTPYGSYTRSACPLLSFGNMHLNMRTLGDGPRRSYSGSYVPRDIQDDGNKVLIEMWDGRSFYYHVQTASFTGFICEKWRRSFFSFYTESLRSLRYVIQKRFNFDEITGITHSQSRELAYMDNPPLYVVRVFALFDNPRRFSYGGYLTDFRGGFVAIEGKELEAEHFAGGDAIEAEAKAILCGLQLARGQGIQRIALVSNAKELVDAINTGERQSFQKLETILTKIIDLLSEFDWAQIFHDQRLSTQVAFQLARWAIKSSYGMGFHETKRPDWFIDG